jgi:hypothetical protein
MATLGNPKATATNPESNMTTTMRRFEGTKRLRAAPMTRGEYNAYRAWPMPEGENPDDAGYLVEYEDGGKPNDPRHVGYISWSPADVFERSYRPIPDDPTHLAPHQLCVVYEKRDLDERLVKLIASFESPTFATVPEGEQVRLRSQARFMGGYSAILAERIAAF